LQNNDNVCRKDKEQPSYMLQKYLRAEPTVSERCSGAVPPENNPKGKNAHMSKAVRQVEDFENAWKKN